MLYYYKLVSNLFKFSIEILYYKLNIHQVIGFGFEWIDDSLNDCAYNNNEPNVSTKLFHENFRYKSLFPNRLIQIEDFFTENGKGNCNFKWSSKFSDLFST